MCSEALYGTLQLGKKAWLQIMFNDDRIVKGLYQFLKKNAAIPFALPRTMKPKALNVIKDELESHSYSKPLITKLIKTYKSMPVIHTCLDCRECCLASSL